MVTMDVEPEGTGPPKEESIPMASTVPFLGNPSERANPSIWEWLKESKIMAVAWTAARVWLGAMWIEAGVAKLWGAENPAFLHNNGAGVAGFAGHGVAAYSWWGSFLHSFVVPNSGFIGIFVALAEFAIGIGLVPRAVHPGRRPRQPGPALHLRDVRHRQRVRLLRRSSPS
jgi:hypothetical protein